MFANHGRASRPAAADPREATCRRHGLSIRAAQQLQLACNALVFEMAKKLSKIRMAIREQAVKALETYGKDPEICRQVEALVGSLDDTMSDEFVLAELQNINASGVTFTEIFATVD